MREGKGKGEEEREGKGEEEREGGKERESGWVGRGLRRGGDMQVHTCILLRKLVLFVFLYCLAMSKPLTQEKIRTTPLKT